ncbi:VOC family protein [Streptomyces griseoincarnatus]
MPGCPGSRLRPVLDRERARHHGDRFPGVILTHTAATRDDVDTLLTAAAALADGQVTAAADRPEQGDHSGRFTDPDGHHWTITTRA